MDLKGFEISGAVFDLDGTIADSLGVWEDIDTRFFKNHNIPQPEDYQQSVQSMDFKRAAEYTKLRFNFIESEEEIIAQWHKMAIDEYSYKIPLKPYAKEFLEKLCKSNVKLALATASGSELFEPLLKRCGVYSLFSSFITTAEAGKDKFSPDIYLLSAERLGIAPQKCMVFEDILPGILSSKKAGMFSCGVYDSHSSKDEEKIKKTSDIYIRSFEEFL